MKNYLLALIFILGLVQASFAARGVDYNGEGNPITISSDATGLKIDTGKSIFLGNGSTFLTGAGVLTMPGAQTIQSLTVNPGNVTVTAGNLRMTNGSVQIVGSGKGVTITNGNLAITSGDVNIESGGITLTDGTIELLSGNIITDTGYIQSHGAVKLWSNSNTYVDSLAGTATAREGVRLLKSGAGDAAAIGSTYRSSTTGKMYIKVANSHADTDWNLVTATDAD